MNAAAVHLWINHLPVVGALVASLMLAVALVRRTPEAALYGYAALVAVGILAVLTYVSGDFAALFVRRLPGFAMSRIIYHELTAAAAMIVSVLVGLLACIPLYLTSIGTRRPVLIAFLIVSLVVDALFTFTAATGGVIRHSEIR